MRLFLVIFFMSLIGQPSWAQFQSWSSRQGPSSLRQKQDNKYRDYWTLSDWFETQRKNRLMDQWLALHSSNPFEFFLGWQMTFYDQYSTQGGVQSAVKEYRMHRGQVGAYASIIGLEAEYADSEEKYTDAEGSIHLRLLGKTVQGTNLTGFYGVRYKSDESLGIQKQRFNQNFTGGSMTLGISRYFGVIGTYKKYFEDKSTYDNSLEGDKLEGTFYIDFSFVRAYGTWFKETEDYTDPSGPTQKEIVKKGVFGGIKIFF